MSQSAWAQNQPKLRGSVESCTDLTPLHSWTFASLFPALLCALDHSSNALALAQVVPQNRVALDILFLCLYLYLYRYHHLHPDLDPYLSSSSTIFTFIIICLSLCLCPFLCLSFSLSLSLSVFFPLVSRIFVPSHLTSHTHHMWQSTASDAPSVQTIAIYTCTVCASCSFFPRWRARAKRVPPFSRATGRAMCRAHACWDEFACQVEIGRAFLGVALLASVAANRAADHRAFARRHFCCNRFAWCWLSLFNTDRVRVSCLRRIREPVGMSRCRVPRPAKSWLWVCHVST